MIQFLRGLSAVVLGITTGILLIAGVEYLAHQAYPLPAGLNMRDPAAVKVALANLPAGALLMVLAGWVLGTFAGAFVTTRAIRFSKFRHGMLVGVLFLAVGISNLMEFPHPLWFWICGVAVFLPAAYAGTMLALPAIEEEVAD